MDSDLVKHRGCKSKKKDRRGIFYLCTIPKFVPLFRKWRPLQYRFEFRTVSELESELFESALRGPTRRGVFTQMASLYAPFYMSCDDKTANQNIPSRVY